MAAPYLKCFKNQNGRDFGNWVDRNFSDIVFANLYKSTHVHFDRIWENKKIEIKAIRAVKCKSFRKNLLESTFYNRALFSIDEDHLHGKDREGNIHRLSNISFQQTKSSEFDIFIGFVFFLDLVRIYIVPSSRIASSVSEEGKIAIINQHRNENEGHLHLDRIGDYLVLEIDQPLHKIQKLDLRKFYDCCG